MLRRFIKDESGNLSIIAGVSFAALLIAVTVSYEIMQVNAVKSDLQATLDDATFFIASNPQESASIDKGVFQLKSNYGIRHPDHDPTVEFTSQGDDMIGTANITVPVTFSRILSVDSVDVKVRSVVKKIEEEFSPPCITALSTTARPGIVFNEGANISAPDCGIQVNSTQNPALSLSSRVDLDVTEICVAGETVLNNSGGEIEVLETGCDVAPDPYAGLYPEPNSDVCDYYYGHYSRRNVTLSPGVYCGFHNFNNSNSHVTFEPGLYVIKNGGWNVNGGNWSGDGVTFYFADASNIQFNNGVRADFTAPTRGDYDGVFMTEAPNLPAGSSRFTYNNNRGFVFEGVMYLPSREIIFNGGSELRSHTMNIVADRFVFNRANLDLESYTETISGGGSGGGGRVAAYISD